MRTKGLIKYLLITLFVGSLFFLQSDTASAYTTNMSASVVVGQSGFTTNSSGINASSFNGPRGMKVCDGKLVMADTFNNRVLIFNSIPKTSGQAADVVIGQPNMASNTANNGGRSAATLNSPFGVECKAGKLFIADTDNARVLIYHSIPTSNGASADLVVGQTSMSAAVAHDGDNMDKLGSANEVVSDGTKLVILDGQNQRFLVWNTIPISNGTSANVVVGSNHGEGCAASRISGLTFGMYSDGVRLYIGTTFPNGAQTVKIWNNIPTANHALADVIIGTCDTTSPVASTFSAPWGISTDSKGRLFIADYDRNRILIWKSVPVRNTTVNPDLVIGQPNMTDSSDNQGASTPIANGLSGARYVTTTDTQLLISDGDNNRVLIFNNISDSLGLSFTSSPESIENGHIRLRGVSIIPSESLYSISNVIYSFNGGGFAGATPTDGSFNSTNEQFYLDVDPTEDYTVRVKSFNSNLDETDHLFYFMPFNLNEPADQSSITSLYPTFDFTVAKQKSVLKENLAKYEIQIKRGGIDSTSAWQTVIDNIPVDGILNNEGNVVFEDDNLKAVYTDESSRIKVYSKTTQLTGNMHWRVVAVDKSGHTQSSAARSLRINTRTSFSTNNNYFPLAILNISGLGNPNITTSYFETLKDTYLVRSSSPIFFGIAYTGSTVTLNTTDQNCSSDCTKTYSTITNSESRFGINIPQGDLKSGRKYTIEMNVSKDADYNELPSFTIQII